MGIEDVLWSAIKDKFDGVEKDNPKEREREKESVRKSDPQACFSHDNHLIGIYRRLTRPTRNIPNSKLLSNTLLDLCQSEIREALRRIPP